MIRILMSSASFYNTIAHRYNAYCTASGIAAFTEEETYLVEMYSPKSVLEFGVGTGRFAENYLARNKDVHYVGVDNAKEMLRYAKHIGANLVLANFEDYLEYAISEGLHFDCIIAPYTALHHIETDKQPELLQQMKKVSNVIILNCLSEKEETGLFKDSTTFEVHFPLKKQEPALTTIYSVHRELREQAKILPSGEERVYLIFSKKE